MRFVGIDVGRSGGIAVLESGHLGTNENHWNHIEGIECAKFKDLTDRDHFELIRDSVVDADIVLIEQVGYMPSDGGKGAFSFGEHFGLLKGIVTALNPKYGFVRPQKWQKELGLIKRKGETNTQKKNRHKAMAQQLFDCKVFHWNADAILIAEYARRNWSQY